MLANLVTYTTDRGSDVGMRFDTLGRSSIALRDRLGEESAVEPERDDVGQRRPGTLLERRRVEDQQYRPLSVGVERRRDHDAVVLRVGVGTPDDARLFDVDARLEPLRRGLAFEVDFHEPVRALARGRLPVGVAIRSRPDVPGEIG